MKKPATVSSTELFLEIAIDSRISDFISNSSNKFSGTDNRRHLRVLSGLMKGPKKREEIDRIAGCSNAPELIAELRRRGLDVPCNRVPAIDRDGKTVRTGVYFLTNTDLRKLNTWQRQRDARK